MPKVSKTSYEILREEIIEWISDKTGIKHIDEPLSPESREGFFTVLCGKGKSINKTVETDFYKILFFKTKGRAIKNYSDVFSDISTIRSNVHEALSMNYESSKSSVIDFNYESYEYDWDDGTLTIVYSFEFERDTEY